MRRRPKTSEFPALDVRELVRKMGPEWVGRLGSVPLTWAGVPVTVRLVSSRPNYGGARYWAACPSCSRRCAILYLVPIERRAGCRACLGLVHPSSREGAFDRAIRRMWRHRDKLGPVARQYPTSTPPKPRWMRWRTYDRIRAAELAAVPVIAEGISARFGI